VLAISIEYLSPMSSGPFSMSICILSVALRLTFTPFSFELRKVLYGFSHNSGNNWRDNIRSSGPPCNGALLVFATKRGGKLSRRNILRDCKRLSQRLGITIPSWTLHAFRHTFVVNYLWRSGSMFHLQKCLGTFFVRTYMIHANMLKQPSPA
jgi:integrase